MQKKTLLPTPVAVAERNNVISCICDFVRILYMFIYLSVHALKEKRHKL